MAGEPLTSDFPITIPAEVWMSSIHWTDDGTLHCTRCDEKIRGAFQPCTIYHLCSVVLDHVRTH